MMFSAEVSYLDVLLGPQQALPGEARVLITAGVKAHCPGRPLRINFMSRYICFSQIGPFDVCFEELFSKVQNPGGFFRKIVF